MASTSRHGLRRRDIAYYRRRQQNNVFVALTKFFADEAAKDAISKKALAERLGKDPSQITRWLSAPSNFELDTISDILLAMDAEMEHRIVRFSEQPKPNYVHPLMAPYLGEPPEITTGWKVESHTSLPDPKERSVVAPITASGAPAVEISITQK
jgi:hypothetical protein